MAREEESLLTLEVRMKQAELLRDNFNPNVFNFANNANDMNNMRIHSRRSKSLDQTVYFSIPKSEENISEKTLINKI